MKRTFKYDILYSIKAFSVLASRKMLKISHPAYLIKLKKAKHLIIKITQLMDMSHV